MYNPAPFAINDIIKMEESIICSKCSTPLMENDTFCNNCGYPEKGSQNEKGMYEYRIKLKKDVLDDAKKKLRNVKILLGVLAGINILFGIYFLMNDSTFYDGLGSLITAAVFSGCALWVDKQPLTGILAGFGFWILLQLMAIFIDPANLFSGIILKIIFIAIFIKGIASAKDAKVYTDQLKEMKAV